MAITRDQVLHVAKLAQLGLSEEEVTRFSEQLSAILESVGKIAELDLAGIEPTSHPLDIVNVFGEDEPEPSLSLEEALANAPDAEDEAFGVPTP
jgi:aspartyl-tRNA(Asn)/glutamyl-tRNA(Gln) amidotransferase subunit C